MCHSVPVGTLHIRRLLRLRLLCLCHLPPLLALITNTGFLLRIQLPFVFTTELKANRFNVFVTFQ